MQRIYCGLWLFGDKYVDTINEFNKSMYDVKNTQVGSWCIKIKNKKIKLEKSTKVPGLFSTKKKWCLNMIVCLIQMCKKEKIVANVSRIICFVYYCMLVFRCISTLNRCIKDPKQCEKVLKQYDRDRKQILGITKHVMNDQWIPYLGIYIYVYMFSDFYTYI